jgi:hypothetical protein
MRRLLVLAFAGALLFAAGCGGAVAGAGATGSITAGPAEFAIPLVPDTTGTALVLGFKNLLATPAPVSVTARLPGGAPYALGTITFLVPALGETRFPLGTFTGPGAAAGGWVHVDTRDVATPAPVTGEPTPVATTGFVVVYVKRFLAGVEDDAAAGEAFRVDTSLAAITEHTFAYQVVNHSVVPMAAGSVPTAADWTVAELDAFGAVVSTATFLIPANASTSFTPVVATGKAVAFPTPPPGQSAPAGTLFKGAVAGIEADPQVQIEARLLEVADTTLGIRAVGFPVRFGNDGAGGDVYDFSLVLSNRGTARATATIEAILGADGQGIWTQPIAIGLDSGATKVLRTTTIDSRGLDLGETSPFQPLFGPVGAATSVQVFWMWLNVPSTVDVSLREYDSVFKEWYQILPGRKQTTDVTYAGVDVVPTLPSGTRNWITLMNPRTTPMTVQVRAYTPGGVEYILSPLTVPPLSRRDYSPDGTVITEVPSDPMAPPVPFVSFRLSASGGMFFGGRKERRDIAGFLKSQTSQVIRDNFFE